MQLKDSKQAIKIAKIKAACREEEEKRD